MTEQRIREQALLTLEELGKHYKWVDEGDGYNQVQEWNIKTLLEAQLDKALKAKGIRIESDDSDPPYSEYVDGIFQSREVKFNRKLAIKSLEKNAIYEKAQEDMLKAGFIRVIPKEE